MKLSEYKEDYYTFTGKLSDITRQIAFAGIVLIWIFKTKENNEITIDSDLVMPAILIVGSLATDMIQYIYQSIAWSVFYTTHKRNGIAEDDDVESSEYLNYPSWFFFIVKVGLVIAAYISIFTFLYKKFVS